jgi:hypothetical protein
MVLLATKLGELRTGTISKVLGTTSPTNGPWRFALLMAVHVFPEM